MKFLRKFLDKQEKKFTRDGKLKGMYPLFEAIDTFLYTPGKVTPGPSHIRDAMDLKRMMTVVCFALLPTVLMAFYNTGYQANLVLSKAAAATDLGWRAGLLKGIGVGIDHTGWVSCALHGVLYFLPVYIVTMAVGGFWEVLFACVRKHEINEGFMVTGLLFPLILPPTIPLWQVAVGISFGVVIGKEVFGGVGMNIFNPALTARAFLFFAYPAQISGDTVWFGVKKAIWPAVDGITSATPLAQIADKDIPVVFDWGDAFFGLIPGSMGETSALACLIGAFILIVTRVGSWRIMASIVVGMTGMSLLLNWIGSPDNPMFAVAPWEHFVLGGFAFGCVYMATDPVTAAITKKGKYYYGLLIGILVVLVRVVNPAFPEGMMLAILFGNLFAPLIDHVFIKKNIKRRKLRYVRK